MEFLRPRNAIALELDHGDILTVQNHAGGQVCDLVAYARSDLSERLSGSHTFAFEETTQVGLYSRLWSNCANALMTIVADDVGMHDLHLPPCSDRAMAHFFREGEEKRMCRNALVAALEPYGISMDSFETCLSVFTNVRIDPASGSVTVMAPEMIPPGTVKLRAERNLLIGLSTCSTAISRDLDLPSIRYQVEPHA